MWDIRDVYHVYNIVFSTAVTIISVMLMILYYDTKKIRRIIAAVALLTLLQNAGIGVVRLMMLVVFEGWIILEAAVLIHRKDDDDDEKEESSIRDMIEHPVSVCKTGMASSNTKRKQFLSSGGEIVATKKKKRIAHRDKKDARAAEQVSEAAAPICHSGGCGNHILYIFDESRTLRIYGYGSMYSYAEPAQTPWHAFKNEIEKICIDRGVTEVGDTAFAFCRNLREVILQGGADGIRNLGKRAFYMCGNLERISLPDSLCRIGEECFDGCHSLSGVKLPKELQVISPFAFADCPRIREIHIPAGTSYVGDFAFAACLELEELHVDEKNPFYVTIDNVLYSRDMKFLVCYPGGKKDKTFCVPESVLSIGAAAFCGAGSLKEITLPSMLHSIDSTAFGCCFSLENIYIPESVEYCGDSLFFLCRSLKRVSLPGAVRLVDFEFFCECEELEWVFFTGNAPIIEDDTFKGIHAVAYYPEDNRSWDETIRGEYGGELSWIPLKAGRKPYEPDVQEAEEDAAFGNKESIQEDETSAFCDDGEAVTQE